MNIVQVRIATFCSATALTPILSEPCPAVPLGYAHHLSCCAPLAVQILSMLPPSSFHPCVLSSFVQVILSPCPFNWPGI
ncbi:hypothetical protein DL93DRAFT_724891 [Clavulina sp. PMI_390]|nr:hypothetical protein DL93DRAFT_724891 [Clavulina sp. PMI_390]